MKHEFPPEGPPEFDADAVGRIASHVDLVDVHLLGCHFERSDDDSPFPDLDPTPQNFGTGLNMEWELKGEQLGCIATFSILFEKAAEGDSTPDDLENPESPFVLVGRFRLVYEVAGLDAPDDQDILQFVSWNAIFHAWPYWREFVGAITQRSEITFPVIPVWGIPKG